jgi:hypothetical protein
MNQRYEYKFVRLEHDTAWLTGDPTGPSILARETYQETIHEHARQGWRFVQIFAPGAECWALLRITS